jgi:diguanylate cyclase (GGDEF)-like protein
MVDAELPPSNDGVESMFHQIALHSVRDEESAKAAPIGSYDPLWQSALVDPATGKPNQLLLLDRLAQALKRRMRNGGHVTVFYIELANLVEINGRLGYTFEDEAVREVTRRLTKALRDEDTIGRVGRSELVAVVMTDDEHAVRPMARLQDAFAQPISLGGQRIVLLTNLGIVVAQDGESAESLLARARRAAYEATSDL